MNDAYKAPLRTGALDSDGTFGRVWVQFWRIIEKALAYIGDEVVVQISATGTNQAIETFDAGSESVVEIDMFVQRWASARYGLSYQKLYAVYNPYTSQWEALATETKKQVVSSALDLTFSLSSAGALTYSANAYTDSIIDRLVYRKRSIAAKNSYYSRA